MLDHRVGEHVVVALGSLSFQFGANVGLVCVQRVKLADVLGEIVVKRRKLGLGDAVDLHVEDGFLARQLLRVILGREGDVQVLLLADVHADHLLFKARDEGVAADLEGLALGGAAGELHAVHAAGVIEVHGVALGNRAVVNGDLGGLLIALLLDLGVHLVLGHEGVLAS